MRGLVPALSGPGRGVSIEVPGEDGGMIGYA